MSIALDRLARSRYPTQLIGIGLRSRVLFPKAPTRAASARARRTSVSWRSRTSLASSPSPLAKRAADLGHGVGRAGGLHQLGDLETFVGDAGEQIRWWG